MLTKDGRQVTADTCRHKYGGDKMAEYLDFDITTMADRHSGDCESPTGHFAQFGKRILRGDEYGFVEVSTFATEADATVAYDVLEAEYSIWADDEIDDHQRATLLAEQRQRGNRLLLAVRLR